MFIEVAVHTTLAWRLGCFRIILVDGLCLLFPDVVRSCVTCRVDWVVFDRLRSAAAVGLAAWSRIRVIIREKS